MSMRISGLASGMDIDSLVKTMMQPAQLRIDKTQRQIAKGEWLQEAYHDLNSKLARFVLARRADFGLTATSFTTGSTINRSASNMTWLKTAQSSDDHVLQVTATAEAVDSGWTVRVDRLAENWSAASITALPALSTNPDGSAVTDSLTNQFSLQPGSVVDFTLNTGTGKLRITSDQAAVAAEGVQLVVIDLETASLGSIAGSINRANIGLKASYDAGVRRFFLQTANSGSKSTLTVEDSSTGLGTGITGFLAAGGADSLLRMSAAGAPVLADVSYAGIDALLDIGAASAITQSSNEFSVNGVNYSLRSPGEVNVQVSTDIEGAYAKINTFVDEYNKLVDELNGKLTEKYDRSFQPLTDAEKEAMTDEQVKKWETKAKTGLLANSREISELLSSMRLGMVSEVSGVDGGFSSLSAIGISTAPFSTDGKLEIDPISLKKALQDDADGVMQLLFKSPPDQITDRVEREKQSGIVNRLFGDVIDGMKAVVSQAGAGDNASLYRSVQATILLDFVTTQSSRSVIDQQMLRYHNSLLTLNDRFVSNETRYYQRFTAMEQAIERANQQSAWLSQQFSSMGSR